MAQGEFALVRQHLTTALERSPWPYRTPCGEHDLYALMADAAAQQADLAALRKYVLLAEQSAQRCDHKLYQAIAHRAWGVAHRLLEEFGESEMRLKQALTLFEEIGTRWQAGRTDYELGELARARQDHLAAREHYRRSLAAFEELRAAPDAARTRWMLATLT